MGGDSISESSRFNYWPGKSERFRARWERERDERSGGHQGSACLDVEQSVLSRDESSDGPCQISAQGRSNKFDSTFGWFKLF